MRNRFVIYFVCLAMLNLGSPLVAQAELIGTLQAVEAAWASHAGKAVAMGRVEAGQFKPERVIL